MLCSVPSARVILRALALPVLVAASACAPGREMAAPPDAGLANELGALAEAGLASEAGAAIDAGPVAEAGPESDAGPAPDAAPAFDAAATDAGPTDAAPAADAAPASDAGPEPDAAPALALELGGGQTSFSLLHNGDHVPFIAGPQGGHHVWLSVRVRGLGEGSLRMSLDVVPTLPAPPAHTEAQLPFFPAGSDGGVTAAPGTREYVGWPALVNAPECAAGKPLRLTVRLQDAQAKSIEGALELVPDAVPTLLPTCGL